MKTIKLRLTLDVAFNAANVNTPVLRGHLEQVVKDAVNNGTLTGDTPATVETYKFKVTEIRPRRKKGKKKSNVVLTLNYKGYNIYICEDPKEGLYASIADENGKYIDSTPFRNDVESVKAAAENIIDQKELPRRKTGEHLWHEHNGVTKCVTCFCDEDDAHVGGEKCSFVAAK